MTCLPDSLCELSTLRTVNLLSNRLTCLPERIGDLGSSLEQLELAGNRLTALPDSFGALAKLKKIVLDCNRLTALPETCATLKCTRLSLNFNR